MENKEILEKMVESIKRLEKEVETLKSFENVTATIKTTAGDPVTGVTPQIVINTNDNTVKMWADGGWRTMASGW